MREASRYFPFIGLMVLLVGVIGRAIYPSVYLLAALPVTAVMWGMYAVFHTAELKTLLSSRTARYGAGSTFSVVLVIGIMVFVTILTDGHNQRFDVTAGGRNSLARQTVNILKNLDKDVAVTGFFQGVAGEQYQAEELFQQYAQVSKRFRYEMIDPDLKPSIAREAGITQYGSVLVACGDEQEIVTRLDEEKLTNALLRVTRPGRKKIYFLTGHGERNLLDTEKDGYRQAAELLKRQNYIVESLLLLRTGEVPEDAAVLVVAGPMKDPEPLELDAMTGYLARGGKVLFLIDPEPLDRLATWFEQYGVVLKNDMVVDKMSRRYGGQDLSPIVADYEPHPITRELVGLATFFPMARSVGVVDGMPAGVEARVLMRTSRNSWAETDLDALIGGSAALEPEDLAGPVPLAVVGSLKPVENDGSPKSSLESSKKQTGRFEVVGDSDFASNANLELQANSDLFLNSIAWLAEEGDLVSIRPKDEHMQPLTLSLIQGRIIFWFSVVMMPLAVLVIGFLVVWRRRKMG